MKLAVESRAFYWLNPINPRFCLTGALLILKRLSRVVKNLSTISGLFKAARFCWRRYGPKILQMGYTRARRYANHKGEKYQGPVPSDKKVLVALMAGRH